MIHYPESIQRAIKALSGLPGVGTKTAERLALFILRKSTEDRKNFVSALANLSSKTALCTECGFVTENSGKLCEFCSDAKRHQSTICVVGEMQNVQAIEKSGAFTGKYHILGGTINPIEGISADMLSIRPLLERIKKNKPSIKEIILATGTDIEGEQTALYLTKLLKPLGVLVSRLATGLPRGSNLEYADELTLADAIKDRRRV